MVQICRNVGYACSSHIARFISSCLIFGDSLIIKNKDKPWRDHGEISRIDVYVFEKIEYIYNGDGQIATNSPLKSRNNAHK